MDNRTRYTFWFRKPSGQSAKSSASPTMAGVRMMLTDMLVRHVAVPVSEAEKFAEDACTAWEKNMHQRIEHDSGYTFHLTEETVTRHRFN